MDESMLTIEEIQWFRKFKDTWDSQEDLTSLHDEFYTLVKPIMKRHRPVVPDHSIK